MDIEDLQPIITETVSQTVNETVSKLKKAGLLKDNRLSAYEKTERILRDYDKYKVGILKDCEDRDQTKKFIIIVDHALSEIENDYYYAIIPMMFFNDRSREEIAEHFNVDVKTITRHKKRFINELKLSIFSDDSINELFL